MSSAIDIQEQPPWWASPTLWIVLAVATTIPFFFAAIPPLTDLPNHVARFHIILNFDRTPFFQENYTIEWRLIGNLGVDILVWLFGPIFGAETATRLVTGLIPPLTVAGIYATSRALNGEVAPSALVAVPLAYTWPLYTGFLNFCLSMAMALLVFAFWVRMRERSFLSRLIIFAPLSFVTWVAHIGGWGLLGLSVLGFELVRSARERGLSVRGLVEASVATLPFALMIAFTLMWRSDASSALGILFEESYVVGKLTSVASIFREQYIVWDLFWLLAICGLTLAFLVFGGLQINATGLTIAILTMLAFAACPWAVFGSYFADRRLLAYAAIFVPLAVGLNQQVLANPERRRILSLIALCSVVLFTARIAVTSAVWHQTDVAFNQHLALLEKLPRNPRVFALKVEPCPKEWYRAGRINHLHQYVTIRKDGLVNGIFQDSGWNQVQLRHRTLDGFDSNMGPTVRDAACPPAYSGQTFQSSIKLFPRNQFDYLLIQSKAPLPTFDVAGLKLLGASGNDRLFAIVKP
jgi:hypothetical protein